MTNVGPTVGIYDTSTATGPTGLTVDGTQSRGQVLVDSSINQDPNVSVGALSVEISSRLLAFIRNLFQFTRDDNNLQLLLKVIQFQSTIPSQDQIKAYFQQVNLAVADLGNQAIDGYNSWLTDLKASGLSIAIPDGSEYVNEISAPLYDTLLDGSTSPPTYGGNVVTDINGDPVTFSSAGDALQALSDAYNAAVAQWQIDGNDTAFNAAVSPLLAKGQAIYDALQLHSNTLAAGTSPRSLSDYSTAVSSISNSITGVSPAVQQTWDDYNSQVAQLQQGFYPPPPLLPTDTFLSNPPVDYTAPSSSSMADYLFTFPGIGVTTQQTINANSWSTAILNANTAISNMNAAAANYTVNQPIFTQANALAYFVPLDTDPNSPTYAGNTFYSQFVQTQLPLFASEFFNLIQGMTGLDNIDFLSLLNYLRYFKVVLAPSLVTGLASSGGTVDKTFATGSQLLEVYGLSLSKSLVDQTQYDTSIAGGEFINSPDQPLVNFKLMLAAGLISILGASVAFDQITQLEADLNNLSDKIGKSVHSIDTARLLGTSFVSFIKSGFESALASSAAARGVAVDQATLDQQASDFADLLTKIVLGQHMTVAAKEAGLPDTFVPSYLVDVHAKALIDSSTYSEQFLADRAARGAEADKINALFAPFAANLSFGAAGLGFGTGDLQTAIATGLSPLGYSEAQIAAVSDAISEQLAAAQGTLSLSDLRSTIGASLSGVMGGTADPLSVSSLLVQLNANQVNWDLQNNHVYAKDRTLTDSDKAVLTGNLQDLYRGQVEKNYVGFIKKEAELVNNGARDKESLRTIAQDQKDHYDHDILLPSWAYNQMIQQDGRKFLGIGLYHKILGDNPVYTPSVRNTQQPA